MSDSFGNISSPVPRSAGGRFGGKGQTVQILNLPSSLDGNPKALRIEGQITSLRPNNIAQIQTSAGNIDVQVKGNRTPQVGQQVEIEIPPARVDGRAAKQGLIRPTASQPSGNNSQPNNNAPSTQPNIPESARIRATYQSPAQPTPQTTSPAPRQTIPNQITSPVPQPATTTQNTSQSQPAVTAQTQPQAQTAQSQTPNALLNRTALPPLLQTGSADASQIRISQANITQTLDVGSVVRLLPTPPAQAQNIATQFFQTLPTPVQNIVTQTAFLANLISQNVQTNIAQTAIQIGTPAQIRNINLTQNILNPPPQNLAQAVQNIALSPIPNVTAQASTPVVPPQNLAPVIPQGQTIPVQSAESFLQTQNISAPSPNAQVAQNQNATIPATLTPAPITTPTSNATQPAIQPLGQTDVQVTKISLPQTILNVPVVTTNTSQQIIPATTNFAPPLISNNPAPAVTAQVTGFTPQNLPLVTVQWPGTKIPQSFVLQGTPNNLQLGSQLQLIPKTTPQIINTIATNPAGALKTTFTNPLFQGFQWPALDDLILTLQQSNPQLATSLVRTLPNAGNPGQIATNAMAFIAAVRSGDIAGWLGNQKTDALRQIGKSDILNSLTQSGRAGAPAPTAEVAPMGEWRAVPLPMFWEGEIHKITLYTRREDGDEKKKENQGGQTRFVFDLSLSRMGDIQLDGLLRDKRLDLVVRAQNGFSLPMQQTMRQAYSGALENTELTGELNFQGSTKNWVHVLEQKEELGVNV
jgi:hypothetical protein